MTKKLCGKPVKKARNGKDRGYCTRPRGHMSNHGNRTCYHCSDPLTKENCAPSRFKKGSGMCASCAKNSCEAYRRRHGTKARNYQTPETFHKLRCGCEDILPKLGESNQFVYRQRSSSRSTWACRVEGIIKGIISAAKKRGYKPILPSPPHSKIREMMKEPKCWRCGKYLDWTKLGHGKTPRLHHDHDTGEAYGFVCGMKCNNVSEDFRALKLEMKMAYEKIAQLEAIIIAAGLKKEEHSTWQTSLSR
jgi:hypothetical protein